MILLDTQDGKCEPPLMLAVLRDHLDAARVLLQHGADVNQLSTRVSIIATPPHSLVITIPKMSDQTVHVVGKAVC